MDIDRLVYIIAATFGLDYRICTPARDLEAEGALTRALARSGGDGLTACHEDAGACPKPCLRHRRVNVGIWPNWRLGQSMLGWREPGSKWPNVSPFVKLRGEPDCGTYQEHLAHEELKRKLASYLENIKAEQARTAQFLANQEATYLVDITPNGASGAFGALLDDMVRQARNITQNMGISPLWNKEPNIINPPDTTWYAQYPEQVWHERSEPQWTVTSLAPRSFEGRTYRFDPISITVPLPAESPQPSSSLPPSLDASLPQPSPDSAT